VSGIVNLRNPQSYIEWLIELINRFGPDVDAISRQQSL